MSFLIILAAVILYSSTNVLLTRNHDGCGTMFLLFIIVVVGYSLLSVLRLRR
jgi:hypothetical protein